MKRGDFLKGLLALPFAGKLAGQVEVKEEVKEVCEFCKGRGVVPWQGPLPQEVSYNQRWDHLPELSGGFQITEVSCPECRAGEYREAVGVDKTYVMMKGRRP